MGFNYDLSTFVSDVDGMSDKHQDNKNDSDSEVALDLQGRKHTEQFWNIDGVYWLIDNKRSSHVVFPLPGRASADALRQFLGDKLPPNLITDEYGCVKGLGEISEDHLPKLQAQLWLSNLQDNTKTSSQSSSLNCQIQACGRLIQHALTTAPSSAADVSMAQEALLVACHATFVAELLQSNHIFVLHNKSRSACEFSTCRAKSADQPLVSTLTIEPLVHWGTVTPTTDINLCRGRIQAFRRDGEKCADPLWTLALEHFTSQQPISYCSGCLDMLMDNPAEAGAAIAQKEHASFTPINRTTPGLHVEGFNVGNELGESDKERFILQCSTRVPKAAMCEDGRPAPIMSSNDQALAASFSLDGACDARPSRDCSERSINKLLDSDDCEDHDSSVSDPDSPITEDSPFGHTPFTQPSTMPVVSATSYQGTATSVWTAVNQTNSFPSSPLVYHFYADSDTRPTPAPEHESSGSNSVNNKMDQPTVTSKSFTPLQSTKRKFGRELDTNAVLKSPKKTVKMLSKDPKDATDIRNFLSSALKPLPLSANRTLPDTKGLSKPWTPRDASPENVSETSWSTTTAEDVQTPDEYPQPPSPTVPPPCYTKPLPKKEKAPVQSKPKTTKAATARAAPPKTGPFTPFFAKRTPIPAPDTISSYTHSAHQIRHPSASEIICSCRKPALTSSVMIAQCTNHSCAIVWYHYDCLDKSSKISCRHGRLVCQHCRNETYFADLASRNGWSVEKMVEKEMEMPFTGKEMVAAMPGVGGRFGVVRPYGFGAVGDVEEDEEEVKQPARGALGELGFFGYVESRPERVREAYTTARAYIGYDGYEEVEYYGYEDEDEYEYGYDEGEYNEAEYDEAEDGEESGAGTEDMDIED